MRLSRRISVILMAAGAVLILTVRTDASITSDSSLFEEKYEGDLSPPPGYTLNSGPATMSTDGNILTFQAANGDAFLTSDAWPGSADDAGGWALEVRLKIIAGAGSSDKGIAMRFGDAENSAANPQHQLFFREGKVTSNFGGTDVIATMDTTDAFHVYRVAEEGGSNTTRVWIDGVEVLHTFVNSPFGGESMWFGAGGGGFDGKADIDYIRWTGDPAHVPEPSTWLSLISGAVALIAYRFRRRSGNCSQ
jgi:hypothetical protein